MELHRYPTLLSAGGVPKTTDHLSVCLSFLCLSACLSAFTYLSQLDFKVSEVNYTQVAKQLLP